MKIADAFRRYVKFAFHALLGDFSWRPPFWLRQSGERVAQRPFISLLALVAFVAAGVGALFLWNGWKHRPVPLESDWIIQTPSVPEAHDAFAAQPLWIKFDRSVASLAEIDKPGISGVTLSPDLRGRWRWTGGTSLMFEPGQDWPGGRIYRVILAKSLFSPRARGLMILHQPGIPTRHRQDGNRFGSRDDEVESLNLRGTSRELLTRKRMFVRANGLPMILIFGTRQSQ